MNPDFAHFEIKFRGINYEEAKPSLTVILFDYIQHVYIKEAIESVINQSISKSQVELMILTDDGGENFSYIPETFPFVVYYTGLITFGESMSLGLQLSRGDIIFLLDNDDRWSNDKLSSLYAHYKQFPDVGFIKDEVTPFTNSHDRNIISYFRWIMNTPEHTSGRFYILEKNPPSSILGRNLMHNNSSMSFRKSILIKHTELLLGISYFQDLTIFFIAALNSRYITFFDKGLTYYRVHGKSLEEKSNSQKLNTKVVFHENLENFINNFSWSVERCDKQYLKDLFSDFTIASNLTMKLKYDEHNKVSTKNVLTLLYNGLRTRSPSKILLFFLFIGSKVLGRRLVTLAGWDLNVS